MYQSLPAIRTAALTLLVAFSSPLATEEQPQAEILHWWSSTGEAAALQIFIDKFKSRGGHYYDTTNNNEQANREEAIERMAKGYPATLTVWNAGWDAREFFELGLTSAITDSDLVSRLKKTLPESVLKAVTYQDKIIAMPINIHGENWMWHSNKLVKHSRHLLSNDFGDYLKTGEQLSKQGIPLVAVGDQPWQVRILFASVMLGVSRDNYKAFFIKRDKNAVSNQDFKQTLTVFNKLAKYSKSFGDGNWNTQVNAVANNQAASTFMGDWAKGEFQTLGKTPGKDYGCTLTSTEDPSLLLVIDTFILGKVYDPADIKGQQLMLDVVSNPDTNEKFNAIKGSVSPFKKPANSNLDVCNAQVYKALSKPDVVIPPYASYGNGNYMESIGREIYGFWKDSQNSTDDEALITATVATFRDILSKNLDNSERTIVSIDE